MAKKTEQGVTFGRLRRRKSDTNGVWGYLANEDTILMSTGRAWRLPAWFLPSVAVAALTTLVTLCFLVAGLLMDKPNSTQVLEKARKSVFEVSCGNAAGTGVAINVPLPDGFKTAVFSAAHIFDDCDEESAVVVTNDGRDYKGILFRKDPQTSSGSDSLGTNADIAVIYLKFDLPKLDAAPAAQQGDWAMVLGNPWSNTNYATFGIISHVSSDEYGTDAAVSHGNSGGPLLNSRGEVLGILSYFTTHSEEDIAEGNKSDVYDQDHGIAFAKRLKLSCERIFFGIPNCPFQN